MSRIQNIFLPGSQVPGNFQAFKPSLVFRSALFLLTFMIAGCATDPSARNGKEPYDYVDPLIGSVAKTKFYGRTFPGATLPFSLVQLGPDTYTGGDVGSGYSYEHNTLEGFSFIHMSGIGWFGDFGNLLVTPANGDYFPNRGSVDEPEKGYRSRISHETETARPGYYSIRLEDYGILAEMSTTRHAGILRFTFPEDATNRIQIDLARRIGGTSVEQYIKVLDDRRIEGWMKCTPEGGGWGNGKTNMVFYTVYFSAEFSEPFQGYAIVSADIPEGQPRGVHDIVTEAYQDLIRNSAIQAGKKEFRGKHLGFYASYPGFEKGQQVLFKAGISFTDPEGARKNLEHELDHWDFDRVVKDAGNIWKRQLELIQIDGATEKQKEIFYTALYHTRIDPRRFTDADGRFYLKEQGIMEDADFNYRTIFSGWDAFRSHIPLLSIIDPNAVEELVQSLIAKAEDGGMGFPKWEIAGCYSNCMLGDPAIPVILDAYTKGINGFDLEKAYKISKQTSMGPATLRNGWEDYNNMGRVACDTVPERWRGYYKGVSATLENAYADWAISRMAEELGDTAGVRIFRERSQYYRNVFDPETGFVRGKFRNGEWIPWEGELAMGQGCIESNPLQQMWFVPHDVEGLKSLMGEERFLRELETMFDRTPEGFPFNEFYNHANEPVHHVPYLFNFTDRPWLTQKWVRRILDEAYDTGPYGIRGNDDVGQMSAWYILSAMGFHPVCPGDGKYMLGSPLFPRVEIKLDPEYYEGESFTVISKNNSPENIYVQSVSLNGVELDRPWIFHHEITGGGELIFEMGDSPERGLFMQNVVN